MRFGSAAMKRENLAAMSLLSFSEDEDEDEDEEEEGGFALVVKTRECARHRRGAWKFQGAGEGRCAKGRFIVGVSAFFVFFACFFVFSERSFVVVVFFSHFFSCSKEKQMRVFLSLSLSHASIFCSFFPFNSIHGRSRL